jgi:hypothetical protein
MAVKQHVKATGDPVWDLTSRIIEKRFKPGDSVKSILNDFTVLYKGLKRLAPKSVSETSLDVVRKFLAGDSGTTTEGHAKRRARAPVKQ